MTRATAIPPVGARFRSFDGDRVLEYVGVNLNPQYDGQDRYIVRVVETAGRSRGASAAVGQEHAVEAAWFTTHKAVR